MTPETGEYQKVIEGLMRKLDDERLKSTRLESELSVLKDADATAKALAEKDVIISDQKAAIDKLTAELQYLRRKVWGSSSEKRHNDYDTDQLTLNFAELDVTAEDKEAYDEARRQMEDYRKEREKQAGKRRASGHSRRELPDNLRRERLDVYPEGYNEEEWELLPSQFDEKKVVLCRTKAEYYVVEYTMHCAVRKDDATRKMAVAKVPEQTPVAKSYAGSSVLANLMVGKYVYSLPFYRQLEMMRHMGLDLPPATVSDWFLDVADLLRPFYMRIRELVMEADYIQVDETTMPIVNSEKHRTIKGYLWQVRSVMGKLMYFHYDNGSRSQDVAKALLALYKGAMQTDGYAVYDAYEGKPGVLCLNCWAHDRRMWERALGHDKSRAEFAMSQIGLLYDIEHKADDEHLSFDERRDLRIRLATPILRSFEAWLRNEVEKVLPKSPIGKAIRYTLAHYDRLCRYVVDGRYRMDSNMVEQGQRVVALSRKNYLFCMNHSAAEDAAVMYTVFGCCRLAGVNPEEWLNYFLNHVHDYDNDYSRDLVELLPSTLLEQGVIGASEYMPALK